MRLALVFVPIQEDAMSGLSSSSLNMRLLCGQIELTEFSLHYVSEPPPDPGDVLALPLPQTDRQCIHASWYHVFYVFVGL